MTIWKVATWSKTRPTVLQNGLQLSGLISSVEFCCQWVINWRAGWLVRCVCVCVKGYLRNRNVEPDPAQGPTCYRAGCNCLEWNRLWIFGANGEWLVRCVCVCVKGYLKNRNVVVPMVNDWSDVFVFVFVWRGIWKIATWSQTRPKAQRVTERVAIVWSEIVCKFWWMTGPMCVCLCEGVFEKSQRGGRPSPTCCREDWNCMEWGRLWSFGANGEWLVRCVCACVGVYLKNRNVEPDPAQPTWYRTVCNCLVWDRLWIFPAMVNVPCWCTNQAGYWSHSPKCANGRWRRTHVVCSDMHFTATCPMLKYHSGHC